MAMMARRRRRRLPTNVVNLLLDKTLVSRGHPRDEIQTSPGLQHVLEVTTSRSRRHEAKVETITSPDRPLETAITAVLENTGIIITTTTIAIIVRILLRI